MKRPKAKTRPKLKKIGLKKSRQVNKTHLSNEKLKGYKKILILRKGLLLSSFSQMEKAALSKSRREASGDLSNVPIHMADQGSDTYEQDFTIGLIENEGEEIQEIDAALERIEDKTYGVCDECHKPILEKRLKVIPYTCLCIKCREKEESDRE